MFFIENIFAFLIVFIVNGIATFTKWIGNSSTGEISDKNLTKFTPAGYTFSIWSVIYAFQIVFLIGQFYFIENIGIYYVILSIANCAWIFTFGFNQILLSFIFILILYSQIIIIYILTSVKYSFVTFFTLYNFTYNVPFSMYFAWVTVATTLNFIIFLNGTRYEKYAPLIPVILSYILNFVVLYFRRDFIFSLVILWALIGVIVKQKNEKFTLYCSIVGIVLNALTMIVFLIL